MLLFQDFIGSYLFETGEITRIVFQFLLVHMYCVRCHLGQKMFVVGDDNGRTLPRRERESR